MCRRASRLLLAATALAVLLLGWAPPAAARDDGQWSDEQLAACQDGQTAAGEDRRDLPSKDCERLLTVLSDAGYSFDEIEGEVLPHVREECGPFGDEVSEEQWTCVDEAVEGPSIKDALLGMAASAVPGGGFVEGAVSGGQDLTEGFGETALTSMYEWVADATGWVVEQVMAAINEGTHPDVTSDWFGQHFDTMAAVAGVVMLPLLMVHTITRVVRGDVPGLVKGYLVYVPLATLGTAVAIPLVDQALGIVDSLTGVFLTGLGDDLDTFTEALLTGLGRRGPVAEQIAMAAMVVMAAALLFAGLAVWIVLVLRDVGIFIALFFLPLGFAALVWPTTRVWFGRLVKLLATLVLSKFFIVGVISLGAAALSTLPDPTAGGASTLAGGAGLLLLAALAPVLLLQIADVAGDQLGPAVEGATTGRTSPVSTSAATRSLNPAKLNRMMNDRRDGPAMGPGGGSPRKYLDDAPMGGGGGGGDDGGEPGAAGGGAGPSDSSGGQPSPPGEPTGAEPTRQEVGEVPPRSGGEDKAAGSPPASPPSGQRGSPPGREPQSGSQPQPPSSESPRLPPPPQPDEEHRQGGEQ